MCSLKSTSFTSPWIDFIVLDMEEDRNVHLILGWPFLATGRTLIDVEQWKLIFQVQEQVNVNVFKAMEQLAGVNTCFNINSINK